MWLIDSLRNERLVSARSDWTRLQVLQHQDSKLRDLLGHLWSSSRFYREYYADHGIRRSDLSELSVRDLPPTDKNLLMENFDRISPDPVLRRAPLECWLSSDSELLYARRYVVVHTSGSSGNMGIFVFDKAAWTRIRGVTMARATKIPPRTPLRRTRLALCAATHGHFGAVTGVRTLPKPLFRVELCSVLDPLARTLDTLNRFQPDVLFGYASTLHELANAALEGRLEIHPSSVSSAGEVLTDEAAIAIEKAFGHKPTNMYASSESPCLAVQIPGQPGLTLMEDEHILELLDEKDEPVAPGEVGSVMMTSLYNRAIPLVRYRIGDYVTRGQRPPDAMFDHILRVEGRINDALPVTLDDGSIDRIHPIVLSEFFVPGAQKFQFRSESPDRVRIRYVANTACDEEIQRSFDRILAMKSAGKTNVIPERVERLPIDPKTGKYRLVVVEVEKQPDAS